MGSKKGIFGLGVEKIKGGCTRGKTEGRKSKLED